MAVIKCLLLLLLVALAACHNNNNKVHAKFVVINNSGQTIDSVRIMPDVQPQYKSIEKGREKDIVVDMSGIAKVDGAYELRYNKGSVTTAYVFGYYTNGYPLENYTVLTILPDTILIKPHYNY